MTFGATACALFGRNVDSMFRVVDDAHAQAGAKRSTFHDMKVDPLVRDEDFVATLQSETWDEINKFGTKASNLLREMAQAVIDTTIAPSVRCSTLGALPLDTTTLRR
jgi:hypothetical protein